MEIENFNKEILMDMVDQKKSSGLIRLNACGDAYVNQLGCHPCGGAGNDQIDGGTGDDLIGGGAGADTITGGAGDDYISSSANIETGRQSYGPQDEWNLWGLPTGSTAVTNGATWGVYKSAATGTASVWSGITNTNTSTSSSEGDVVDAGAGNDQVIGSWADDRIEGGDGKDQLDGLAGNDILEGGAGDDNITADGIIKANYLNSVSAASHGNDFVDFSYHGSDYLDCEDRNAANDLSWKAAA